MANKNNHIIAHCFIDWFNKWSNMRETHSNKTNECAVRWTIVSFQLKQNIQFYLVLKEQSNMFINAIKLFYGNSMAIILNCFINGTNKLEYFPPLKQYYHLLSIWAKQNSFDIFRKRKPTNSNHKILHTSAYSTIFVLCFVYNNKSIYCSC